MKKKLLYKLISAAFSLFIAMIMIIIIYATLTTDSKAIFGYRLFVIATGSMSHTIEQGEMIVTKVEEHLQVDDIITFISNEKDIQGRVNTHRIFAIESDHYITKGDANAQIDSAPVFPSNVLGKVVWHSAFIGHIIKALSKPLNMLIFIVVPIIYIAITDILSARKKMKKLASEQETNEKPKNT